MWNGYALAHPYMHECSILDREVSNFVLMPDTWDGGRSYGLMWKPLAESGLWDDVIEHDPKALTKLEKLLKEAGKI
jgi:hypothetical protein